MTNRSNIRIIAGILIVSAVLISAVISYRNGGTADRPLIFSDRTMMSALWEDYKKGYWEPQTGRTIDRERNGITTSEGQSYTMLRAVWESDQTTFDKAWKWTKTELQRPQDGLFAWEWGKLPGGTYGVMRQDNGQNTAADADTDIALALLLAAGRWQESRYLDESRKIMDGIWTAEVVEVNGKPYLASDNLEKQSDKPIVINPSYLSPYAFKDFAKIDRAHDWLKLADTSYELLDASMTGRLDKTSSAGLPPDWVIIDRKTGQLTASGKPDLSTNYGFDAMRVAWRLALDYQWFNDKRSLDLLRKMSLLGSQWREKHLLFATYAHDGSVINAYETPAMYGSSLGYFKYVDTAAGKNIYDLKLKTLYDADTNGWVNDVGYYGNNWAWFGMALYNGLLDNTAVS